MGYKFRLKNENLSASDLVVYEKFYFNEKLIVDTNLFASKKEDLKKIDTISDIKVIQAKQILYPSKDQAQVQVKWKNLKN